MIAAQPRFAAAGMTSGTFDGIIFQDTTGGDQPTLFLDQIELIADQTPPPPPTPASVTIDSIADRRPISPMMFGVNFGDSQRFAELGYPLRRWGGNATTRYNWRVDVSNRASDYFFQNIVGDVADPFQLPDGSSSARWVDETSPPAPARSSPRRRSAGRRSTSASSNGASRSPPTAPSCSTSAASTALRRRRGAPRTAATAPATRAPTPPASARAMG